MLQKFSTFTITLLIVIGFNINTSAQLIKAGMAPFHNTNSIIINNYGDDSPNASTTAYGNDANNGQFVSFPLLDGVPWTPISTGMTDFIAGADMDDAGNYYGCYFGNITNPQLVSVDVTTGGVTVIGPLSIDASQGVSSLAYDATTGIWYLGTTDPYSLATSMLYSVDITTGATTLIGTLTNCPGLIAMAIDCNGNAYGIDATGDNLVSINLADATGTVVGNLGVDVMFAQDADFDPTDGTLYWAGYQIIPPWDEGGTYRTIDVSTGASSEIIFWGAFAEITGFVVDGVCTTVPVELTSFTANVNGNDVVLNWSTATELNNSGFEIERQKSESNWEKIGFVPGFGTTTEQHSYSFTDSDLGAGTYSYRIKQIDFDGSFEYSNIVNADVTTPAEFNLAQNYPNPFNPSTFISFTIPNETQVKLSVYNSLGEEVAVLVNNVQSAGTHTVEFSANNFASGTYFYKLEAGSFVSVKKMILMK